MDVQEGCILFLGVIICCSGGLYNVQKGYMDIQGCYMLFSQGGYMMKKIMMVLVATNANVVAS